MLAVSAGRRLTLISPATLKSSTPPTPSKQTALDVELSALAWNPDNTALFAAAQGSIRKYDNAGHSEKVLHSPGGSVRALAVKDKGTGTVYYTKEGKAYELDCSTGIVKTALGDHSSPVKSLSLSNDASLLAIASASECTVHRLSDSTHVSLDGFPSDSTAEIAICAFHPHSQTRLLIAYGQYLLIYDTSKLSAPVKSISLTSSSTTKAIGEVVSIVSSPFSKTLVAVGSSSGHIFMIDLEKGKGLFKTLDVKQPLTALAFSTDGATMLMGTENGQLLVQDLRTINKGHGPKNILVSAEGRPVVGLAVQRKIKTASPATWSPTALKLKVPPKQCPKPVKPLSAQDINVKLNPASRRSSASTARPSPSPPVRTMRTASTTPSRRVSPAKETVTPVPARSRRTAPSPLTSSMAANENYMNMSLQMETLPTPVPMRHRALGKVSAPKISPRSRLNMMATSASGASKRLGAKLTSRVSTTETFRSTRFAASVMSNAASSMQPKASSSTIRSPNESLTSRTQDSVPASRPSSSALSTLRAESRTRTSSTVSTSTIDSVAPVAGRQAANLPAAPSVMSRSSSPDFEDVRLAPPSPTKDMYDNMTMNPLTRENMKTRGAAALRLEASTPDVIEGLPLSVPASAVEDGKRKVDFSLVEEESSINANSASSSDSDTDEGEKMQISPRHPQGNASHPSPATALQLTPLRALGLWQTPSRSSASPVVLQSTPGSSAKAQDFMRALMAPALADFQQETRAELLGLHLDMLRLGRDWKRDMREAISEAWTGEVEMLREENRRLREENERLRRGL